jgi:hypothetical protein
MFMVSAVVEALVMLGSRVTYLTAPRVIVDKLRAKAESLFSALMQLTRNFDAGFAYFDAATSNSARYSSGRHHASMLA